MKNEELELNKIYRDERSLSFVFPFKKLEENKYRALVYFTSNDTLIITGINTSRMELKKEILSIKYKRRIVSLLLGYV